MEADKDTNKNTDSDVDKDFDLGIDRRRYRYRHIVTYVNIIRNNYVIFNFLLLDTSIALLSNSQPFLNINLDVKSIASKLKTETHDSKN